MGIKNPATSIDMYPQYWTPSIKENKEVFRTALLHIGALGFEDVYKRMFENIFAPILNRFRYSTEIQQYVMMYILLPCIF